MSKISEFFQNFIMSDINRAIWFMKAMPASFWEKNTKKTALQIFREAVNRSPAYRKFLKENGVNPSEIKNIEEFQKKVPISTKKELLQKYSLSDLVGDAFADAFGICFSSGSTGKPVGFLYSRKIYFTVFMGYLAWWEYLWEMFSKPPKTLFINATPLGIWPFGYTTHLVMANVLKDFPFTYVTPSCDSQMIINILKEVEGKYDQVIFFTLPSFLKKVVDEGEKEGIKWEKFNVKCILGGEFFFNHLKEYFLQKFDPERKNPFRFLNVLASGDAGLTGVAFPLSVLIQEILEKDEKLRSLLGIRRTPFTLFQYNPLSVFLEKQDDFLIITSKTSLTPIVRYKVGDLGDLVPFKKMVLVLQKEGYDISKLLLKAGWKKRYFKWPFLVFYGRGDAVVIIFSGAKISAENLAPLLGMPEAKEIEGFKLTSDKNQRLIVYLELKRGLKFSPQQISLMEKKYQKLVHTCLLQNNIDYKDAYKIDPERTIPQVKIFPYKEGPFKEDLSRPKPRLVI